MSTQQDSTANIAPNDRGVSVYVTTWVFATCMIVTVLVQVALKYMKCRSLHLQDWLLVAAMVLGLGQAIAVTEQVPGGLGQPVAVVIPASPFRYEKAGYASQLLYVTAIGLSKLSSALGSCRLSSLPRYIFVGRTIMLFSTFWAATALVAAALQCNGLSATWEILYGQCINQTSFWLAIGSFDLILDVTLFNLPSHIVSTIEGISWSQKAPLMASFGAKLLVAPFLIARLVLLQRVAKSQEPTLNSAMLVIITQVQMNLSIITTSIPYIKICLSNFEHGIFTPEMKLAPPKARKASKPTNHTPLTIRVPDRRHLDPTSNPGRHLSVRGSVAQSPGLSSLTSSKMIIKKLTTFWVEEEPAASDSPAESQGPYMAPPVPTIRESFFET